MNTIEFFKGFWPSRGIYVLATQDKPDQPNARPGFAHYHYDTIEAASAAAERMRDQKSVYHAQFSFRELSDKQRPDGTTYKGIVREASNTLCTRVSFADLDVGESKPGARKYKTQAEAIAAIRDFVRALGLPNPTVISSGYGIHVYWRYTEDVETVRWLGIQQKLQHAFDVFGVLADRKITTDAARVLRPLHAWNWKVPADPRRVKLLKLSDEVDIPAFEALLDAYLVDAPPMPQIAGPTITTASGIILPESALLPPKPLQVVRECPTFAKMLEDRNTCLGPVWRPTLEVMRLTTGGDAACHAVSKGHPDYDEADTQRRLDRYAAKNLGPPRCSTMETVYTPSPCKGCKHYGHPNSSPIAFARRAPATVLPPDVPPPPDGFKRSKRGIEAEIAKKGEDGENDVVSITIYPYDLYPLRIIEDPILQKRFIDFHSTLPNRGDFVVRLPLDIYVDDNKMMSLLVNNGVVVEKRHAKKVSEYVSLYIRQLQKFAAEQQQFSHFGYTPDQERFILPEGAYGADGVKPVVMAPRTANAAAGLVVGGTLERQVAALRFYKHEAYVKQQAAVCIALAAPIFYMTGHYGMLFNLCGPSGASKSTALFASGSHWGMPDKVAMNGTASGSSLNGRMARIAMLANLPLILDEITDMDPQQLKQMTLGTTQSGQGSRLNQDGTERVVPDYLKSTVLIMSSNPSMHSVLSFNNVAGTAGSMRLLELLCEHLHVHTKREADAFLDEIKHNYGHTGRVFLQFIMRNRDTVKAMVRDVTREVETRGNISPPERFWSSAIVLCVLGARIGKLLGLLDYDDEYMLKWFVDVQLPQMRSMVQDSYMDATTALQVFLSENTNHMLRSSYHNGAYTLIEKPMDPVVARLEVTEQRLWISTTAFRSWCLTRKLPIETYLRELVQMGLVVRDRMDLARYHPTVIVGVGATLKINLKHEAMAEVVQEMGNVVPLRQQMHPKPLVSGA